MIPITHRRMMHKRLEPTHLVRPEEGLDTNKVDACVPVEISDDDIYSAMKDISGYLDITPGDLKEIYSRAYNHAIRRLTGSVKTRDVMTEEVVYVGPLFPLRDVAALMAETGVSGLPVVEDMRPVGMISEKDFIREMGGVKSGGFMEVIAQCLKGGACLSMPVRAKFAIDIMSAPVVTVTADTPILEAATLAVKHKINRLPVVDSDNRVIGIVSRADFMRSSSLMEDRWAISQK